MNEGMKGKEKKRGARGRKMELEGRDRNGEEGEEERKEVGEGREEGMTYPYDSRSGWIQYP